MKTTMTKFPYARALRIMDFTVRVSACVIVLSGITSFLASTRAWRIADPNNLWSHLALDFSILMKVIFCAVWVLFLGELIKFRVDRNQSLLRFLWKSHWKKRVNT
jgi:hypothetical protein